MELEAILSESIGVTPEKARSIVEADRIDLVEARFDELKGLIGESGAQSVFNQGTVVDYSESSFRRYIRCAVKTIGEMRKQEISPVPIGAFESIDAMNGFFEPAQKPRDKYAVNFNNSKFNLRNYALLREDDHQAQRYLRSITTYGYVDVTESEMWTNNTRGPRATGILQKISSQIREMFIALDLPKPKFKLTSADLRLSVPPETQGYLKTIRNYVQKSKV